MLINNTYIVTHSNLLPKLKNISHFTLNLGTALADQSNRFNPRDIIVQKHYLLHQQIIQCLGFIGSLPVYNQNQLSINTILCCNENEVFTYQLDSNLSLYDNINMGLDLLFNKIGLQNNISTIKESTDTVIYQQPQKSFKDFTEAERIAFAANRRRMPSM